MMDDGNKDRRICPPPQKKMSKKNVNSSNRKTAIFRRLYTVVKGTKMGWGSGCSKKKINKIPVNIRKTRQNSSNKTKSLETRKEGRLGRISANSVNFDVFNPKFPNNHRPRRSNFGNLATEFGTKNFV